MCLAAYQFTVSLTTHSVQYVFGSAPVYWLIHLIVSSMRFAVHQFIVSLNSHSVQYVFGSIPVYCLIQLS